MEGYEVVTSDDARVGHVVGTSGDNLIVEHGLLRKTRHALPTVLTRVDEDEQVVRTTVSKQLIEESPKLSNGDVHEAEVAAYYGLADTTVSDEELSDRPDEGVIQAEQERIEVREGMTAGGTYGSPGRQIIPPDPHTSDRSGDERDLYEDR